MSSENKINSIFTIEVIGRPKEHLVETLENISKQLSEEKGVVIVSKKIHEPTEFKDKKELFTSFTELELEITDLHTLQNLLFKYMPSHIEILEPEKVTVSNSNMNLLFNDLLMKLHRYDEVARILQIEKTLLEQKLNSILSQVPQLTAKEETTEPEETDKKEDKK